MGKEHDLLNAAKTGNVSQIEKILGQRGKKSGLQSIIVRSTNPNYQDEMGYTPLHYASLNGHRAAVELLLKYDSSANNPDHSGNYPLHLAAFNGHADACRVLINSGPSRAKVNEQNGTQDTAMHSAAQSKSSQVVAVLLENHADPSLRNCRKESPLDLAAQYGRIENVKLLLSYHPNLLQNNVKTHSPLHLAARNGHIDVVSNLLGCGMAVNFQCDTGTALHEAALFGKLDVCNFLLQCDVDITVKDKNEMTVMDLLMNHPTARTKEISALIYNYTQTTKSRSKSVKGSSQSAVPAGNQRASTISFSSSSYDMVPDPAGRRDTYDTVPPHQQQQQPSMYDSVPPPQRQITVDEYLQPRHDMEHNPNEPPRNVGGYSFLTAPGSQTTAVLTPQKVQEGYTLLGIPVSGKSKAIIDSEYSTVRPEGSQMMVSGSPKNAVMDPQRTGTLDPLPSRDMVSKDNLAYYKIDPHTTYEPASPTHTPTTASSSVPEYEVVPRHPLTQRTHDLPVYEVPPAPIFQTRTNQEVRQPEGDYGLIGGAIATPSKPIRQTRKDGSDVSSSPSVYEVPPSFKQREQREQVHGGSPRGAVCPLDISQNDLEDLGYTGINPIGPEAAALATQPGYEYMDRNSPTDIQYEYEVLGPARGFEPRPPQPSSGQYELISMPARHISEGPPKAPLAQSPPIYEIAPTPILAPQKPRAAAPQMAQSPPIYEIAPTPRPRIPDRPAPYSVPQPRPPSDNVPAARAPQQNVPLIGGMEEKEQPPVPPPRPGNEYQPHVPVHDPSRAPNQQGIPPPYEKVRIEAPKGKLNLDQAPTPIVPPRTHLGDYCTIDPSAISPMHPPSKRDQVSSGSSFGSTSEGSDTSDLPSIPPPPASVAEAVVFETLERGNDTPTPTPKQKPVPLPRRESLNDRPKWHVDRNDVKPKPRDLTDDVKQPTHDVITDVKQDPFSNPPNKQNAITEENEEPTNTFFTNLHKQFSPHGSREDLTAEETPEDSKIQPSPLLYENVLFQRSDSTARGSMTKKTEPQAPEVETENAVKVDSVESKHESRLSSDLSNCMDEEAEWEKINQLLLSFEDIGDIAIQIADASVAKTVPEWLKALGVEQYETDLMNDGFDDLDFLNGGVLEDQDLLDIGVTDLSHRKIILEAAKSLPTPPRVAKLDNPPATVEEWLKLIKLTDYLDVFIHRGFATMERVKMLWEVELTSVLEINCLGHRNRILTSLIEPRRMTMLRKSRQTSEIDSKGNFGLDEKLAELKAFCPDEEPAKVVSSLDSDILNKIADDMINDEGLRRKTLEKRKQKQWRHEPKVLLKGSVNYTTQYLGSQTVKEIVGVKSTVDACRKMKLSTAKLKKIPSVTLAVSVNGIKFIDSRTQLVISNHEMNNVSYITQDPENRRIFAYIAKDAKANRHYCHVFRVDDLAMSDEITMTIGQAFELAFEQFLQIQSLISSQKS